MSRLSLLLAVALVTAACRTKEEVALDLDMDGVTEDEDCDDLDATTYPGADEVCDGLDNDCDGEVDEEVVDGSTWYLDEDGDGFGGSETTSACEAPRGYVDNGEDCDDALQTVFPGADETCNFLDDDCDGEVDEDPMDPTTWYGDGDGDGYGSPYDTTEACEAPSGYVSEGTDCDDTSTDFHPGAPEEDCTDPNDYNCDGSVGYADEDGDGWAACEECDDSARAINPSATEVCDGVDNDCNGVVDTFEAIDASTWYADTDSDGYGAAGVTLEDCDQPAGYVADDSDCDDSDDASYPGATEVCDDADNDCNGTVDDGAMDASTWYIDHDGDGYGGVATKQECDQPSGYVSDGTDCDDDESSANPGATEVCDELDNDCDGDTDEGVTTIFYADGDGDGYGVSSVSIEACSAPSGFVTDNTDCDDGEAWSNPGEVEVCDELDNDCDGSVDEGVTTTFYADGDNDGYGDDSISLEECSAPSGFVTDNTDCDDDEATAYPGGTETCDELDNDCDGSVDEGVTTTYYRDTDGDGYGDSADSTEACSEPTGYATDDGDCDDYDGAYSPGASPGCDGEDYDCDGYVDNDADLDGYSDDSCGGLDCHDSDATVNPDGVEVCDLIDNDCDGIVDNDEEVLGDEADCYAYSCLDIIDARGSVSDGYYYLDPTSTGSSSAVLAYCDMTTDGGGYTFFPVDYGSTRYAYQAESYCAGKGMQLFIPRTQAHLLSAWSNVGASYLYIMGVYPNYNGATCTNRAFQSGTSGCYWSASDGHSFWVSTTTSVAEPNGDNSTTSSMYYAFNSSGAVTSYNDISYPGYGSRYFTCDVGDKY